MIRPAEFIDIAAKLAAKLAARPQATEAELRTAIGRAYYGAIHLAKQFLDSLSLPLKVSIHELHRYLSNSGNARARLAGDGIAHLQTQRIRADYHLDQQLARHGADPLMHARMCVESAKNVESLLATCTVAQAADEIKTGIAEFLKRDPKHRASRSPN